VVYEHYTEKQNNDCRTKRPQKFEISLHHLKKPRNKTERNDWEYLKYGSNVCKRSKHQ